MIRNTEICLGWGKRDSGDSAEPGTVEKDRLPKRTRRALGHEPDGSGGEKRREKKKKPPRCSTVALGVALVICVVAAVALTMMV